MTARMRLGGVAAAVTIAGSLGVCPSAGALAGKRSFAQTYPLASKLCADIARGAGPKHLRRSPARVLGDCSTLQGSFLAARANVLAAEASIGAQIAAQHAAAALACNAQPSH